MTETWTDGNSTGGALRDVFSVDITGATGRCAGCGNTGPLAEAGCKSLSWQSRLVGMR